MSRDDVELLRRGYEAFNRDGVDAILPLLAEDVELVTDELLPEAGVYRGRDAFRRMFESYLEPFEEYGFDVQRLLEAGDRIVVLVRAWARGAATGIDVEVLVAHVWTLRDGKGVRVQVHADRERALREAGLPAGS